MMFWLNDDVYEYINKVNLNYYKIIYAIKTEEQTKVPID